LCGRLLWTALNDIIRPKLCSTYLLLFSFFDIFCSKYKVPDDTFDPQLHCSRRLLYAYWTHSKVGALGGRGRVWATNAELTGPVPKLLVAHTLNLNICISLIWLNFSVFHLLLCICNLKSCNMEGILCSRNRSISFFGNLYRYFQLFFTNIRLATDTDIPKFAYQYFCRYLTKYFG